MEINVVMAVVFCIVLAVMGCLYSLSKKRYAEFIEPLDEKVYRLKSILPIGLFLMDNIGYKYNNGYDRKLLSKLGEVHGFKFSMYYLHIHWANKIAFTLLGLLLVVLIGVGGGIDASYAVFAAFVLSGIVYFTDYELNTKVKTRRLVIQMDFPDFLNKLTLLINAGMTITRAWEKIVQDNIKARPLYDELGTVLAEIKGGSPELQAYEGFAKRCRTPEITRFVSVILQNLKKGNNELASILRVQGSECWEMRKNTAKRLGEEASTKMILPMMIMFIAILIIVAVPAVLSLRGF